MAVCYCESLDATALPGSPWAKGGSQDRFLEPELLTAQMRCPKRSPSVLPVFSFWDDIPAGALVTDGPLEVFVDLFAWSCTPNLSYLARAFPNSEPSLLSLRPLIVTSSFQDIFLSSLM